MALFIPPANWVSGQYDPTQPYRQNKSKQPTFGNKRLTGGQPLKRAILTRDTEYRDTDSVRMHLAMKRSHIYTGQIANLAQVNNTAWFIEPSKTDENTTPE